jgi:hypothetical protein
MEFGRAGLVTMKLQGAKSDTTDFLCRNASAASPLCCAATGSRPAPPPSVESVLTCVVRLLRGKDDPRTVWNRSIMDLGFLAWNLPSRCWPEPPAAGTGDFPRRSHVGR